MRKTHCLIVSRTRRWDSRSYLKSPGLELHFKPHHCSISLAWGDAADGLQSLKSFLCSLMPRNRVKMAPEVKNVFHVRVSGCIRRIL